jgi:L-malate glycosyltransferase
VDTQIFKPSLASQEKLNLKQELTLDKDDIILGFSGELREKKGQKFLLSMLSNLIEKNYKISLLIIGEIRHTQEAILQNYAVEFPQAYEKIKITGHIEESSKVAQYLQLCDLFLLPSIWEGLPNSLLEAMACECCCLASDAGGIPEIITPPINGFILPRPQLPFLTDGVMEFISLDKSLKQKIGQEARKTIVSQFSLKTEGLLLENLLNKLIS